MEYTVGVDIGGTNTRIALIDEHYHIVKRHQFSTDIQDPFSTMQQIKDVVDTFDVKIKGVGLSY